MTDASPAAVSPVTVAADGVVRIRVRLTPKSSKDALERVAVDAAGVAHLIARVRAVPENGAANAALEALIAKALGAAKSAVRVEKGATGRLKVVTVDGGAEVLARAQALVDA